MNKRPANTCRGFTLIELLAVIALVSILAAILVPVAGKARETALRRRAMTEMNAIKVAVIEFHRDHKYMPWPVDDDDPKVGADMWTGSEEEHQEIMDMLTGNNAKRQSYLQIPSKSRDPDQPETVIQFNDPWGQYYQLGMDRNLDGAVSLTAGEWPYGDQTVNEPVLVYSGGPSNQNKPLKTFEVQ